MWHRLACPILLTLLCAHVWGIPLKYAPRKETLRHDEPDSKPQSAPSLEPFHWNGYASVGPTAAPTWSPTPAPPNCTSLYFDRASCDAAPKEANCSTTPLFLGIPPLESVSYMCNSCDARVMRNAKSCRYSEKCGVVSARDKTHEFACVPCDTLSTQDRCSKPRVLGCEWHDKSETCIKSPLALKKMEDALLRIPGADHGGGGGGGDKGKALLEFTASAEPPGNWRPRDLR